MGNFKEVLKRLGLHWDTIIPEEEALKKIDFKMKNLGFEKKMKERFLEVEDDKQVNEAAFILKDLFSSYGNLEIENMQLFLEEMGFDEKPKKLLSTENFFPFFIVCSYNPKNKRGMLVFFCEEQEFEFLKKNNPIKYYEIAEEFISDFKFKSLFDEQNQEEKLKRKVEDYLIYVSKKIEEKSFIKIFEEKIYVSFKETY